MKRRLIMPWSLVWAICIHPSAYATNEVTIAPLDQALTFARSADVTLAVTFYGPEKVLGVDLSFLMLEGEDSIDLINRLGVNAIRNYVERADAVVRVSKESLIAPIRLTDRHIAAGTNYGDHAEEAEVEGGPFLFTKAVAPTGPFDPIPLGDRLLDYEAELCLVTLNDHAIGQGAHGLGLVLCNDVTDREALLHHIDAFAPESGKGFTTGKSAPGFLPIGTLFVVPYDVAMFVADRDMALWVNGEERQRTPITYWIWPPGEILRQAEARRNLVWDDRGQPVKLPLTETGVPARTLILAGTPGGTVFNGMPTGHFIGGVFDWLMGGWDKPLAYHVVSRYVAEARQDGRYLRAGDVIIIRADGLGELQNTVVAP